ncbi:hypothetical protein CesoFtcFv8_015227 [Champsocephalus esox]|uniref:Uncharacterized protein n=1 Tax=Champsocephalus esox TaxID=159716 RepID=A0AAN8BQF0_9TELE|nr:hypothetical protein CesoFtcFv8_015227 [Champsocephalus esox]
MKTLLLASALFAGLCFAGLCLSHCRPYPCSLPCFLAFCKRLWLFAVPCNEINTKVVAQIQAFSPQYRLLYTNPLSIRANHTSLDSPEGENITFTLNPTILTAGCHVFAQSTSI